MVVGVVRCVLCHGILGEGTLCDVNPHATQIQCGVRSACLHPRSTTTTTTTSATTGHFTASATVPNQFLIQFIVQRTSVLVAVQSIVQTCWVQVVVGILKRE